MLKLERIVPDKSRQNKPGGLLLGSRRRAGDSGSSSVNTTLKEGKGRI